MMKRLAFLLLVSVFCGAENRAQTLVTFRTPLGPIELEFFDQDKPVTVSNFIKYVQSGRYNNMFVQRWETNFVIQGGGYTIETRPDASEFRQVPTFGTITNEYSVGRTFSNVYGTIAMARQSGNTNSASSQWFINVNDNVFLDNVDGGFTVFGKVTAGTNILNLFKNPVGSSGIHRVRVDAHLNSYGELILPLDTLPVLSTNASFDDLIYVDVSMKRDVGLRVDRTAAGAQVSWNVVPAVLNRVEFTTGAVSTNWTILTNMTGSRGRLQVIDPTNDPLRIYRLNLVY